MLLLSLLLLVGTGVFLGTATYAWFTANQTVAVNPIDVNNVVGQRRENISNLKNVYDVDLIVKADEKIKQGKSKIEVTKIYEDFLTE